MPKWDLQGSEDEFEHVKLKSITLTAGCNYLFTNALIEEALRIWMNAFVHWAAPCLTVIKSTIQVKKLKNSYNYSSQYTWKSKSYCSSTGWLQALGFRPQISSILAEGINSMAPALSGTRALNDQKLLLISRWTSPKEQYQPPKRAAKTSRGSRRQLPQEECAPLH